MKNLAWVIGVFGCTLLLFVVVDLARTVYSDAEQDGGTYAWARLEVPILSQPPACGPVHGTLYQSTEDGTVYICGEHFTWSEDGTYQSTARWVVFRMPEHEEHPRCDSSEHEGLIYRNVTDGNLYICKGV